MAPHKVHGTHVFFYNKYIKSRFCEKRENQFITIKILNNNGNKTKQN